MPTVKTMDRGNAEFNDGFGIYGEYCSLPYVFKYNPEYWAFHNWLVTYRTRLKSVEQVKRSLKNDIPVWRYKAS